MTSIDEFKTTVKYTFPKKISEVMFIYDEFGKILFKDKWIETKIHNGSTTVWTNIENYIKIIDIFYSDHKEELNNFIFTYAQDILNKLNIM